MSVQFANPWFLYLLWAGPVVVLAWHVQVRRRERRIERFVSSAMQAKLGPSSSPARFRWQAALFGAGLFLMIVACAGPQWGTREEIVRQKGRDLVIALDVSRSMLANDVHPNRLQRAKADLMDLIKELQGDRAALVAFRHKAILLCPLTTDYAFLKQALDTVAIESAPPGETDIGDGVRKALDAFDTEGGSHKAIVLISDGEDLTGRALAAAQEAGKRDIPIFAVGLGNRAGSRIPAQNQERGFVAYQGKDVVSKLDNETLYAMAKASRGAYVPVETAGMTSTTLGTIYRDRLRAIAAREIEETRQRRHVDRYQTFLLPAILLLLAGTLISRGRLASTKRKSRPSDGEPLLKNLNPPKRELRSV